MKKAIAFGAALAVIASAPAAFAGDLPRRHNAPDPYYPAAAVPTFTWTGIYLGANTGLAFGRFTGDGNQYWGQQTGASVGLTGGYNYQTGQAVFGVEGDIGIANPSGANGLAVHGTGKTTSIGTLRGRIGYAVDRALIFATAGYAGANVKGTLTGTGFDYSNSNYHNGFALGAGLEYAFTNNISGKAEYLYTDFGKIGYGGAVLPISAGSRLSQLRAGVNYHF
jgi:outer membrane immunogenic protein